MARSQEHSRARTLPRNVSWPSPPGWRARSGHPDGRERRMRESDTPTATRIGAAVGALPLRPSLVATLRDYGIYLALAALVVHLAIALPQFRTPDNALLVLLQVSVIGIVAIGMTFTILTAGIDLSVGSLLAVAGMFSGVFAQKDPSAANVLLAFLLPVVIGLLGGAINGVIIAWAGVNPLIVTLGTLTAYRGFVVWYRVNPIYDLQPYYRVVGQGTVGPIPIPAIVLLVMAGGGGGGVHYTPDGRFRLWGGGERGGGRAGGRRRRRL